MDVIKFINADGTYFLRSMANHELSVDASGQITALQVVDPSDNTTTAVNIGTRKVQVGVLTKGGFLQTKLSKDSF